MASAGSKRKISRLPLRPLSRLTKSDRARLISRYLNENWLLSPGRAKNCLYKVVRGNERAIPDKLPSKPPAVPITKG